MEPLLTVAVGLGSAVIGSLTAVLVDRGSQKHVAQQDEQRRRHELRTLRADKLERQYFDIVEAIESLDRYDSELLERTGLGVADAIDSATGMDIPRRYWTEPIERVYYSLALWAPDTVREAARRHLDSFYVYVYLDPSKRSASERKEALDNTKVELIEATRRALGADVE